jgi:hypothetical protein
VPALRARQGHRLDLSALGKKVPFVDHRPDRSRFRVRL